MKIYYGNAPVKSLNIKHYEVDTNSATLSPSDLQAGIIAYGKGKKIVGTGKAFEFAYYGRMRSNDSFIIPTNTVNIVHISSFDYPVRSLMHLGDMNNLDFTNNQVVGNLIVDGNEYPITVVANNNEISVLCEADVYFEIFFGKDNYV